MELFECYFHCKNGTPSAKNSGKRLVVFSEFPEEFALVQNFGYRKFQIIDHFRIFWFSSSPSTKFGCCLDTDPPKKHKVTKFRVWTLFSAPGKFLTPSGYKDTALRRCVVISIGVTFRSTSVDIPSRYPSQLQIWTPMVQDPGLFLVA